MNSCVNHTRFVSCDTIDTLFPKSPIRACARRRAHAHTRRRIRNKLEKSYPPCPTPAFTVNYW